MIKSIEEECEKDKSMSNLKGKIKEIQSLMENAWKFISFSLIEAIN